MKPNLLIIDNYDSFTYNLAQMFMCYELHIDVRRADRITIDQADQLAPDYLLISPGPKDPLHAGISIPLIKAFYQRVPVLGVCLGMQCLNEAFDGITVRAPEPVHGKTSLITHEGDFLFKGVPSPLKVARYHSLVADKISKELKVTATGPRGVVMGLSHASYPLHGVQFHPESFMTDFGDQLIKNFLNLGPLSV